MAKRQIVKTPCLRMCQIAVKDGGSEVTDIQDAQPVNRQKSESPKKDSAKTSKAKKQTKINFDEHFHVEEKEKILNFLSCSSDTVLMKSTFLSSSICGWIIDYRKKNGPFQTLSSVLEVPTIGVSKLEKLCNSILQMNQTDITKLGISDKISKENTLHIKDTYPKLTSGICKNVDEVVALDIQIGHLTWAKINRRKEICDLNQVKLFDKQSLRYDHVLYHKVMQNTLKEVPHGDLYMLEKRTQHFKSLKLLQLYMNKQILEALLMTMLNERYDSGDQTEFENRVYLMPTVNLMKLYSLSVGGEMSSGRMMVIEFISGQECPLLGLHLPTNLAQFYLKQSDYQQDRLAICILNADATLKLFIDPASE
ncbi:hypothetical protein CHS0354_023683 [Potamilus streckersoni]|uniref:Transcription elongation factor, mitochondrial n=1 Tax=Potamilus streckersoni TaxID=2493646 RepID=A0AAE0SBD8_9BIVA|nr:hypothetical protein CHS0354_023683 [Potamilus streckersoni]